MFFILSYNSTFNRILSKCTTGALSYRKKIISHQARGTFKYRLKNTILNILKLYSQQYL